ncbi:MAG: hypothetical protein RIQ37_117 [Actinomycetota bacterium]
MLGRGCDFLIPIVLSVGSEYSAQIRRSEIVTTQSASTKSKD